MEHSGPVWWSKSEKREFEDQILNFFLKNLSLRAN